MMIMVFVDPAANDVTVSLSTTPATPGEPCI